MKGEVCRGLTFILRLYIYLIRPVNSHRDKPMQGGVLIGNL
jgi:hypothetical protein